MLESRDKLSAGGSMKARLFARRLFLVIAERRRIVCSSRPPQVVCLRLMDVGCLIAEGGILLQKQLLSDCVRDMTEHSLEVRFSTP
jgi:hypothetical protein